MPARREGKVETLLSWEAGCGDAALLSGSTLQRADPCRQQEPGAVLLGRKTGANTGERSSSR